MDFIDDYRMIIKLEQTLVDVNNLPNGRFRKFNITARKEKQN